MSTPPDPAPPAAVAHSLGDGIYRIALPLPFPTPQAVNCYLFEGDRGLTLLDCGIDGPEEFAMLNRALAGFGFAGSDLHRLVGSHLHVDHMGMAKRIISSTGCEWVMHRSTKAEVPHYNDWSPRRDDLARLVAASGAPPEAAARFGRGFTRPAWFSEALQPTHPVEDGDRIPLSGSRHLEVIFTPGHQANHLCLHDSRTENCSPAITCYPGSAPSFLTPVRARTIWERIWHSLDRIINLDVWETHPGHGPTIERGSARSHQILLHHQRRLETILGILIEGPRTPWDVMGAVFRSNLTSLEERLAFQETMAHLEHLRIAGRVEKDRLDGWWRYQLAGANGP